MVIACPACATRYVVPDSAIGLEGRRVRCAKCRHSWYQEGPEAQQQPVPPSGHAPGPAPVAAPSPPSPSPQRQPEPVAAPGFSATAFAAPEAPPLPPDRSYIRQPDPEPEPTRWEEPPEPVAAEAVPLPPLQEAEPYRDDEFSQFDHEPPFRPRRNVLRLFTWAAAIFALLAIGTVVAVSYWGLPDWVPVSRPTFGQSRPDLQLDFP
ncbi:MAG TPA: MJ0042-type zinc finger domain-containing protein, partial [Croceibacterium sp.]|nr:MJ0042-type zinc finger domain-containing protein [Croceibacterium sp.]